MVRVTVTSATRRVDLVLPGAVPVAELIPELARAVGLLDGATVYGGYHLVTAEGRRLSGDGGLMIQGVEDGGTLTVTAGVDEPTPIVYDDVVEAMTDVVERDLKPWEPASGRRTALWSAALLLTLGAVALLIQGTSMAATAAALVAFALVIGAVVLSRAQSEPEAAVAVAWMGCAYAGIAGVMFAPSGPLLGMPMAYAGGAVALAGVVALLALGDGRSLLIPPVVVGTLFALTGVLIKTAGLSGPIVLTVALVVLVIAGSVFPWLALGVTGTKVDQLFSDADITAEPREVDAHEVASDARTAHEILVSVSATVGLLLVLIAPFATRLGLSGTLLAIMCCAVVMLRTRQYRTGPEVGVGLVSGMLGLAVVAISVLMWHPAWRPTAAVVLAVAGGVLLALTLIPSNPSIRRGRLGDVAESVALLSLLPLTVIATGVFQAIRG
ncbi:MAG: type VII secretion integral membrane protein EccD [Nocardioides sp.]